MRKPATTDEVVTEDEVPGIALHPERLPRGLFTLRQKLYAKAKREPTFRFYTLFGLVLRLDVWEAAWDLVADNGGGPGVDGVTIARIIASPGGPQALLAALREEVRTKRYQPHAVRRVWIPKADGRRRPLGIPTVRDRIVQAAVRLILEPIFEADFLEASYGYRPGRSVHDAAAVIDRSVREGYRDVYDADLRGYFDTIPHDKLMKCVERRVADRSILHLLRQWLVAPVEERDEAGRPRRSRPTQGTPQGGVISPLLANLYLHWMDVRFHRPGGPGQEAKARLVRYADDFVIVAKRLGDDTPRWVESIVEGWLGLTINRDKTRIVQLRSRNAECLRFVGYEFRYAWSRFARDRRYFTVVPSTKSVAAMKAKLREVINSRRNSVPVPEVIAEVNQKLGGWQRHFCYVHPRAACQALNHFVITRLIRHLKHRSQRPCRPPAGMSWYAFITGPLGFHRI